MSEQNKEYAMVPVEPTPEMLNALNDMAIEVAMLNHGANFTNALKAGYDDMLSAAPKTLPADWTSVADRLPEIGVEIRFKTRSENIFHGWLTADDDWWVPELNTWIGGNGHTVAHWMPLSAAPTMPEQPTANDIVRQFNAWTPDAQPQQEPASATPEALLPHLRQYQHNDCSGFVFGYDLEGINRLYAELKKANSDLAAAAIVPEGCALVPISAQQEASKDAQLYQWLRKNDEYVAGIDEEALRVAMQQEGEGNGN